MKTKMVKQCRARGLSMAVALLDACLCAERQQ